MEGGRQSGGVSAVASRLKHSKISSSSPARPASVGSRLGLGPVISKLTRLGSSQSEVKITPGDLIDHESSEGRQAFVDQLCYLLRHKCKVSPAKSLPSPRKAI